MEFDQQQNAIKELRARNRNMGFVISILSLCLLVSVVSVLSVLGTERTIVVPPNITQDLLGHRHQGERGLPRTNG